LSAKTMTAKIMLYLRENPGASLKSIAQEFNMDLVTARNIIYRLKSGGYVEKTGSGYILTSKGEWFVSNIVLKKSESPEPSGQKDAVETEVQERSVAETAETGAQQVLGAVSAVEESSLERDLLSRVEALEKEVTRLKEALEKLVQEVFELKNSLQTAKRHQQVKREEAVAVADALPKPIMELTEAERVLGTKLTELIRGNKVEVFGRILVDKQFFENFKKKLPLPVDEVDSKLDPYEKLLFDILRREGFIIQRGGAYTFLK